MQEAKVRKQRPNAFNCSNTLGHLSYFTFGTRVISEHFRKQINFLICPLILRPSRSFSKPPRGRVVFEVLTRAQIEVKRCTCFWLIGNTSASTA